MPIARLRLGIFGTLRTQLVVTVTLALAAVAIPYADAAVKANGIATGKIISTTTVSSNVNPSLTGQTVTFTASVTGDPITSYTGPGIDGPMGITTGPDGALWFTNFDGDSVGRITTAGVVTNYAAAGSDGPRNIVTGPDRNLWFTSYSNHKIGKVDLSAGGAVTLKSDAANITSPYGIAVGPDGKLWFADNTGINQRTIGRITTDGEVDSFSDGPPGCDAATKICEPTGIVTHSSDGALWYTNSGSFPVLGGSIGRITTLGVRTNYTGTGIFTPLYITVGSDAALWFTNWGNSTIGRITTAGEVTNYDSDYISGPWEIARGSDDNIWFANAVGNSIGRITTAGKVVTKYTASSISSPHGVISGPDGALWFTNYLGDSIGRIATAAPNGATATGTVQFSIDGATFGSPVALNGAAQAQITVSTLTAGNHTITAAYGGDATHYGSTSAPLTQTVTRYATTTVVTSNQNPSVFGQPVTFTTTVTSALGTPTGTVNFMDGSFTISGCAAAPLNGSGQATCGPLIDLSAGNHTITAVYSGDPTHNVGSSILTQTIIKAPTTTALTSSQNPSVVGQPVSFTATVTSAMLGTPTGTVNFWHGGVSISGCGAVPLNGSGQATCGPLTDLAVGDHAITAVYSGDANLSTSTSPVLTQTVNAAITKAATTTAVTSDSNPSLFGQPVTFTAAVTSATPGTPIGTVNFMDGGTTISGCATAALNATGQATCGPLIDLSVGNHTITAVYSGDANFAASTSAALTQTVTALPTVDTTPPQTGNVSVVLRLGGTVSSAPLLVSWSASDNVSATADLVHQIQVRRLQHGAWGPWTDLASATGSQLETVQPLLRHYQYRVHTRDLAGNWGAWAESAPIVLLRRDEGRFSMSSGWTRLLMTGAMRGDVAQSSIIGSWARLRFWGSDVALVMSAGAGLGSVEVCVDAGTAAQQCKNVDLATLTPSGQRRLVAVFNGLTDGRHHLRVRVTGGTVNLDGALIGT